MAAPTPASQLRAWDRDDLDTSLAQARISIVVTVVGHNHTRFERQHIVAVFPLLALGLEFVTARRHLA